MRLQDFTLLFVEDDLQIQELMKTILEEDVKAFYQAYNGEEGMAVYLEKRPDIILTDINMPIMDGMQMSQKIKEIDKTQPILIMSAFDDKEVLLDAVNSGIDAFIVKPVDMMQLYSKLEQIIKNIEQSSHSNVNLNTLGKKEEEIQHLYKKAHYDALTDIPNRYLFNEKIDKAITRAKHKHTEFVLFFIDLDDFKLINDTYGHKAGDKVLVNVVHNITSVIRKDDMLARIGGDEFALIVENAGDRSAMEALATKIIHAISEPIAYENEMISVSCSIGICRYPKESSSKEELIHRADLAMYQVKSGGKSHFSFCKSS